MAERLQPGLDPEQVAQLRELLLACPSVADRNLRLKMLVPAIQQRLGASLELGVDPRDANEIVSLIMACERFGAGRGLEALTDAVRQVEGDSLPVRQLRAFVRQLQAPDPAPPKPATQPGRRLPVQPIPGDQPVRNPITAAYRRLRKLGLPQWASIATIVGVLVAILGVILQIVALNSPQDPVESQAAPTLQVPSTVPTPGCGSQPDAPYLEDGAVLADGGTDISRCFRADSPWHLEASGTDGQPCDMSVLNESGTKIQGAKGTSFQVQERQSGRFKLHLAQHCRVVFRRGTGPPRQLPFQIPSTARGGATPVFRSANGFIVRPSTGCRVVVFRSFDGTQVQKVSAGTRTEVLDSGLFWIETEQRNCSLTVTNA